MLTLISKGNWRNYYGLDSEWVYHEMLRVRGLFYRTKFVLGEGLRPIGDPLKHSEFTLIGK